MITKESAAMLSLTRSFSRSLATGKGLRRKRGFTLVELLVAMVVLVLMVALLSQVLSFAQIGLGNLGNSALRRQDAGTVLANMAKDLRSSIQPLSNSYQSADSPARQIQLLINPAGVPVGSNLNNANTLFFGTAIPSTAGGAGLVGYFVRWVTTAGGTPQPLFCRMFLNTDQAQPQLAQIQSTTTNTPEWISTAVANTSAPADQSNGYQGWLADNIIALYVRALDPNMNAIEKYAQPVAGVSDGPYYAQNFTVYIDNAADTSYVNKTTVAQYDSRLGYQYPRASDGLAMSRYGPVLPAALEIVIIAAEPKEIARLTSPLVPGSSGDPAKMWNDVDAFVGGLSAPLKKTARVYSTVVAL